MAIPRVFVASTCYDLKYIRDNLRYFIQTIGYEPVLSEDGTVFYDPSKHTHTACLTEVPNCQLLVLVIGGRFGGSFKETDTSITNMEYEEAVRFKIPVFALVEQAVYAEHHVFTKNKTNSELDARRIIYPAVDDTRIFNFVDEVRKSAYNNAIFPFRDFSDMENYLRRQWAGLMFSFLTSRNEENRVADVMSQIVTMNERIGFLTNQLVKSVGSRESNLLARMYDVMLDSKATKCLLDTGHKPDPIVILQSKTLTDCAIRLGRPFILDEDPEYTTSSDGSINVEHLAWMETWFIELRKELLAMVTKSDLSIDDLVKSQLEGS